MSESDLEKIIEQAASCLGMGDYPAARSLYKKASVLAPTNACSWLMLGIIDAETGRYAEAIENLDKALYHDPELAEAHLRQAQIALKENNLTRSHEALDNAVSINPDYTEAWITLGLLQALEGNNTEAKGSFTRAGQSADSPERTWSRIANKLHAQGSTRLAIDACHNALKHDPGNLSLWSILGKCYRESGDLQNAINAYKHILSLDNNHKTASLNLAELHLISGQLGAAIKACEHILALHPDNAEAYSLMGTACQIQGNLVEASESLHKAVSLSPHNPVFCYKYGCILQVLGELDKALEYFTKATSSSNPLPAAIGGIARIHMQKGNYDEVERLTGPLMNAGASDPQVLPTLAAIAHRFNLVNEVIQLLETATANSLLGSSLRSRLYHSLGTLYEKESNYEAAFTSHKKSKELLPAKYDSASNTRYTDRIITTFSRSFMENAARSANRSDLPVFIVGMPRSGTTLIEQIIASHGQVHGAGELPYINRIVQSLSKIAPGKTPYPECARELSGAMLDTAADSYIRELRELSPDAARVTDKMPHNFRHLGLIGLLFPKARIIHISRDPMDTCLSCYFQEFSMAHAYTCNLGDLGRHYNDYKRLMRHWDVTLKLPIMNVAYEELVTSPGQITREIIKFCGLEWDTDCLNPHDNSRIVTTLSTEQVRKPIYSSSIGRWKRYDNHLDELKAVLDYRPD